MRNRLLLMAALLALLLPASMRAERVVTLTGGTMSSVSWREAFPASSRFDEWEVFLSANGGRHYFARLTPELDRAVGSFEFRVPDVAVTDGRLLFRHGDGKHELGAVTELRVTIVPTGAPATRAVVALMPGEAAYPGDRGIACWTNGPRDGSSAVLVLAPQRGGRAMAPPLPLLRAQVLFVAPLHVSAARSVEAPFSAARSFPSVASGFARGEARSPVAVRLQTSRINI